MSRTSGVKDSLLEQPNTSGMATGEDGGDSSSEIPKIPLYYLAVRVTTTHDRWDDLHACLMLDEVPAWVAFPHTGKEGNNPHFHIAIPTDAPGDTREADKFRKRLQRKYKGNQEYSVKLMHNGMLAAIQYMSKEGTDARIKGPQTREWIEQAPAWEHREPTWQTGLEKKRKNPDSIPQITYSNMLKVCARWRSRHELAPHLLKVLDHMLASKEWQLSIGVIKGGIPQDLLELFTCYLEPKGSQKKFRTEKLVYKPGFKNW